MKTPAYIPLTAEMTHDLLQLDKLLSYKTDNRIIKSKLESLKKTHGVLNRIELFHIITREL